MLLSRDIEHCIPQQILYIAVLYSSLFGLLGYSVMAQRVSVTSQSPSSDTDPVVKVLCMEHGLPSGYTDLIFQWEHNGIVLSRNDVLVDADSSRYSVGNSGREIVIQNAVRDDGGRFICRVLYRLSSNSQEILNVSNSIIVSIKKYLPPIDYPKCSISPNTGITVGNEVTFICDSGESSPPVTLHIQKPDEDMATLTSSGMVPWTVREEDIMAKFMCFMTSNTFSTALRTCSAAILRTTTASPTPTTQVPSAPERQPTSADGPPIQRTTVLDYITFDMSEEIINASTVATGPGSGSGSGSGPSDSGAVIAGAVIGVLLVLLVIVGIIVVVIIFIRRKSEEKPPPASPSKVASDTGDLRGHVSAADNTYYEETIDNSNTTHSDRSSTSTGHIPTQPRPVSVVYGVVDKTKSHGAITSTNSKPQPINPKCNGNAVYEIADLDKQPPVNPTDPDAGGSEMPVYGKVNKGYTTDAKDDSEDKRESSGFVDNAIYVSSQM